MLLVQPQTYTKSFKHIANKKGMTSEYFLIFSSKIAQVNNLLYVYSKI